MDILGWIVVGLLAGAISGALVGGRTARGCLPNVIVGILGGVFGGWLVTTAGMGSIQGFIARPDRRPSFGALTHPARDSTPSATPWLTDGRPALLAGPRGRHRRRDLPQPYRRRARTAAVSRLPDRRPRRARQLPGRREPALDRRLGPDAPAGHGARPARGHDGPAGPARRRPSRWMRCGPRSRPGAPRRTCLAADRRAGAGADRLLAVGARRVRPPAGRPGADRTGSRRSTSSRASCTSSTGDRPDPGTARALDAYFIVGAEHGFNASTFTARVITSTRSDIASAVAGAIGTMKGPLHGGAPSEVVDQLNQVGSADHAEAVGPRGARPRRAADGLRASRLSRLRPARRRAAQGRRGHAATRPTGSSSRSRSRTSRCGSSPSATPTARSRPTSSTTPRRCSMGVGLAPDLFPATFSLARHAGWTAHVLEQAADNRLIRPDVNYVGPAERDLPA